MCIKKNWRSLSGKLRLGFFEPPRGIEITVLAAVVFRLTILVARRQLYSALCNESKGHYGIFYDRIASFCTSLTFCLFHSSLQGFGRGFL